MCVCVYGFFFIGGGGGGGGEGSLLNVLLELHWWEARFKLSASADWITNITHSFVAAFLASTFNSCQKSESENVTKLYKRKVTHNELWTVKC